MGVRSLAAEFAGLDVKEPALPVPDQQLSQSLREF